MPEKNVIIKADQPKQYVFPFFKKDSSTNNRKERVNLQVTRLDQTNKVLISIAPFQH